MILKMEKNYQCLLNVDIAVHTSCTLLISDNKCPICRENTTFIKLFI